MKKNLAYLFLLFCSSSYANNIDNILQKYDSFIYDYVNNVEYKYSIGVKNYSLSNGNSNDCKINISYAKEKPILVNSSFNIDIEFTVLHEISHCVLERKVMYSNIQWIIKDNDIGTVDEKIKQSEVLFLKQKKGIPLLLTYHEIYADVLASLLLLKYNHNYSNYVKEIMNKRFKDRGNKYNYYQTDKAIKEVLAIKDLKNLNSEDIYNKALEITQKSFILYVKENI